MPIETGKCQMCDTPNVALRKDQRFGQWVCAKDFAQLREQALQANDSDFFEMNALTLTNEERYRLGL